MTGFHFLTDINVCMYMFGLPKCIFGVISLHKVLDENSRENELLWLARMMQVKFCWEFVYIHSACRSAGELMVHLLLSLILFSFTIMSEQKHWYGTSMRDKTHKITENWKRVLQYLNIDSPNVSTFTRSFAFKRGILNSFDVSVWVNYASCSFFVWNRHSKYIQAYTIHFLHDLSISPYLKIWKYFKITSCL